MARLEQMLDQIAKGRDVRQNLIEIRQSIADESLRRRFLVQMEGDFSRLTNLLLTSEDPKIRKNAALILGMTQDEELLPVLFEAWEKEETLFVRMDYLKAISGMDYREYLPRLEERVQELSGILENSESSALLPDDSSPEGIPCASLDVEGSSSDVATESSLWDNDPHLLAELSMLRRMIMRYEKQGRHHFIKMNPAPDLILRTNVLHSDVTAGRITKGSAHAMRGGVHVKGGDLNEILKIRTWTECLLPVPGARPITGDEKMIAAKLRDLKIGNFLNYLHENSGQPYRYRIELRIPSLPDEKKGEYIRRIASRLDVMEKGKLLNSESDYEVELRLIERGDHSLIPMLKLFTLPDERFSYRKETTAQSTSAPVAALAVALAAPYLKEGAQILDPFCGVGTLLIERCLAVPADPVYGVDLFGEAVEKARVNSSAIEKARHAPFHYVNRDFFDFTHEYPFDEIITHLPDTLSGKEESTGHFLQKSASLLKDSAVVTVLTDAPSVLREASANTEGYTVKEEFLLNERTGFTEVILGFERA